MKLPVLLFLTLNILFIPIANSDNMQIQMQVDRSKPNASPTPAERPQLTFSGKIKQNTCPFSFNAYFLGRIQDGHISGMAGEGTNYDWAIANDGTFQGRLPLKKDASGEQIYQTINGRITNKNISINIQYGTSNRPDLYCISNGNNIFVGG